ncbi:hypothetical protein BDN72DRAFT_906661 [Pluteus cervinus]|uniref:Uncharacterized protein n=1 Tax=Pluteus cervinus TaxID=181527 RepID=A0ACD3A0V5_9AGAR|nr:hypothetical protein BDN72DRAFT_906661 [Pluteus cervinus]
MDLSGLTNDESFAKIDSEISQLEKRLWTLRSLRNTLPPISCLPNEILMKIFLICHDFNLLGDPNEIVQERRGKTRLTLSWVSHRWRSIALSFPDLWLFVTKGDVDYMRACIERSKGLHIAVDLLAPHSKHIQVCLAQMARICSLEISLSGTPSSENIDPDRVWEQPAPHLVSLTLKHINIDGQDEQDKTPLFSAVHPRLQHLTIYNCEFRWNSPIVTALTLTTLHITDPDIRVELGALVEMLRAMTCLVNFKLDSCLMDVGGEPSLEVQGQQVQLPNLRTLMIWQRPAALLFALLSRLDVPNSSVIVETVTYRRSPEELDNIFQVLETYWHQTPYWAEEDIRHISLQYAESAFDLVISTSSPVMPVREQSRQFTMSTKSYNFEEYAPLILPRCTSSIPCNPHSVFLDSVSREVVYSFARFANPRVLRLVNIQGPGEYVACLSRLAVDGQEPTSDEYNTDRLFLELEELEVDGKRYGSFQEFHCLVVPLVVPDGALESSSLITGGDEGLICK